MIVAPSALLPPAAWPISWLKAAWYARCAGKRRQRRAAQGTLSIMVGGEAKILNGMPIFQAIGKKLFA
ncbi:MAG: hypothetical protein U0401_16655 [Anaerolineae bacterium]